MTERIEALRTEIARLDAAEREALSHGAKLSIKARNKRRLARAELAQLQDAAIRAVLEASR